jgi:hypothetical protein
LVECNERSDGVRLIYLFVRQRHALMGVREAALSINGSKVAACTHA